VALALVLGTVFVALRANRLVSTDTTRAPGISARAGWTQVFPTVNPPARSSAAMAYDQARQEVVLFGSQTRNDTWLWDGKAWVEATQSKCFSWASRNVGHSLRCSQPKRRPLRRTWQRRAPE